MKKVLSRIEINYILLQMLGLTFVCTMLFIDIFINKDIEWLTFGIIGVTVLVIIIYEIILNYFFQKNRKSQCPIKENKKIHSNNEKYLWFLLLLLVDLILIAAIVSKYTSVDHFILIVISLVIYYLITSIVRPYFGVNHYKK